MPAHLRPIPTYRCVCGKPAKVQLFNTRNAPMGHYCKACGKSALADHISVENTEIRKGLKGGTS